MFFVRVLRFFIVLVIPRAGFKAFGVFFVGGRAGFNVFCVLLLAGVRVLRLLVICC